MPPKPPTNGLENPPAVGSYSPKILVSAGEASGDLYAATLVDRLRQIWPDADFFGCTGPRLRQARVRTIVDAASLAVVGLVEVVSHIPRIYGEYRRLLDAVDREKPDFAILTDSPDFHLRVAKQLKQRGIPVIYLVAPQVWAWRKDRLPMMRRNIDLLLCLFPFEEQFFRDHGINATYIGHPLTRLVRPTLDRSAFLRKHGLSPDRPTIGVLPGSRRGEAARHLRPLLSSIRRLDRDRISQFLLPASATTGAGYFRNKVQGFPIEVIEGETWDVIAHSDLVLAASGTVTIEAAILGTPMVTFYKVTALSWVLGKLLVNVPFYCMVNLVAGRKIVPELMQQEMTGERIALEAEKLLQDSQAREEMQHGLNEVRRLLESEADPMDSAAVAVRELISTGTVQPRISAR